MNRALWLQELGGQKAFFVGKNTNEKDLKNWNSPGFVPPPFKDPFYTKSTGFKKSEQDYPSSLLPRPRKLTAEKPAHRFFSAAFCSLFTFIATIFAAIGLLQIMISSLTLQPYAHHRLSPGAAVHKPGAGPAPKDAVENEYQHALTREMVAAADTSPVETASYPKISGVLEGIKISEEKAPRASKKQPATRLLKIVNSTKRTLDKVIVQIDILTKSGAFVRTENHTVNNLVPLGTQTVELSAILPGAQIHCFVQEITSKSLHTSLRSL